MNDDSRALAENRSYSAAEFIATECGAARKSPDIPDYLQDTYWWAYLHPKSIWFFERDWVVNLILWGNMKKLTGAVLRETRLAVRSRVLQVACVYGDFSNRLAAHLGRTGSRLDLVDVAPIQLRNAAHKLRQHNNISFHHQDSSALAFPDASFDQTVLFFLLHEQPEAVRRKTISEAIRVTRPGGKIVFVDYHGPHRANPLRYLMKPLLAWLEPYAMDLWREGLPAFMPGDIKQEQVDSRYRCCGGLYQKVVITRR
jgi:ubiquinone/menaquinone biosynthesis C-methylase UbiE